MGVSLCPDSRGGLYPSMGSMENTLHSQEHLEMFCHAACPCPAVPRL